MKKRYVKFLKTLLETPSPTGSEENVAALVREYLQDVADEIQTDTMGSVHAILSKEIIRSSSQDVEEPEEEEAGYDYEYEYEDENEYEYYEDDEEELDVPEDDTLEIQRPVIMLAAHMDEVGLMVTYISPEGFLSVAAIGGVDAAILPGMRVDVHTATGSLRGIVGRKPIHLIDADERKSVTPLDKLVIDLGLPAAEVKAKVRVGDSITYGVGFEKYGKDMAVSKSFDDKCGVFVACRVMENLANEEGLTGSFVAAITVQEEIGTRGAITSAYAIHPDVAIAFDVTHATDYPGIDKTKYGDIRCGKGPVIARGPNINPFVFERLVAAAEAEGIAYQLEAEPGVTGTDARAIQVAQEGIPTGLVSVPLRYMHTPTEAINLSDLEGAIRLITRFATDLEEDPSFIPGISPEIEHPESMIVPELSAEELADQKIKKLKKQLKEITKKLSDLEREGFILPATEGDATVTIGAEEKQVEEGTASDGSQSTDSAAQQNPGAPFSAATTGSLNGSPQVSSRPFESVRKLDSNAGSFTGISGNIKSSTLPSSSTLRTLNGALQIPPSDVQGLGLSEDSEDD